MGSTSDFRVAILSYIMFICFAILCFGLCTMAVYPPYLIEDTRIYLLLIAQLPIVVYFVFAQLNVIKMMDLKNCIHKSIDLVLFETVRQHLQSGEKQIDFSTFGLTKPTDLDQIKSYFNLWLPLLFTFGILGTIISLVYRLCILAIEGQFSAIYMRVYWTLLFVDGLNLLLSIIGLLILTFVIIPSIPYNVEQMLTNSITSIKDKMTDRSRISIPPVESFKSLGYTITKKSNAGIPSGPKDRASRKQSTSDETEERGIPSESNDTSSVAGAKKKNKRKPADYSSHHITLDNSQQAFMITAIT